MEHKLRKTIHPIPQDTARWASVKKPIDLPPVDICYISAVGFYQNLVQPNTVAFITSLYEINQMLKKKESKLSGQKSELIDKELVE